MNELIQQIICQLAVVAKERRWEDSQDTDSAVLPRHDLDCLAIGGYGPDLDATRIADAQQERRRQIALHIPVLAQTYIADVG